MLQHLHILTQMNINCPFSWVPYTIHCTYVHVLAYNTFHSSTTELLNFIALYKFIFNSSLNVSISQRDTCPSRPTFTSFNSFHGFLRWAHSPNIRSRLQDTNTNTACIWIMDCIVDDEIATSFIGGCVDGKKARFVSAGSGASTINDSTC